jgi:periplasmic protein CpxP/Spy
MKTSARNNTVSTHWRLTAGVTVLALAAVFTQTASASPLGGLDFEGRGGHAMAGSPRHLQRMLEDVKATPEQIAQVKQITDAVRADMATQREAIRKLREQSRALFSQPTVDARMAETLRSQLMAQYDQLSKRMLQMRLDISRVLSPEQRTQLSERMKKRHDMMQRHRQEREALEQPRG